MCVYVCVCVCVCMCVYVCVFDNSYRCWVRIDVIGIDLIGDCGADYIILHVLKRPWSTICYLSSLAQPQPHT